MNEVQQDFKDVSYLTPIEIALGIDENGMTTARKLYEFLGLNPSNYSKWCKTNITENEFAVENEDYFYSSSSTSEQARGNFAQDYKLTAHFAKKLSTKGYGTKAELAREYFTTVEERAKKLAVDRSRLDPQMKLMYGILDGMAQQQLEQKRQAAELELVKENQKAITQALVKPAGVDFRTWVNGCLSAIAESENFLYIGVPQERHQAVRTESYQRLTQKRPCRLDQRVSRAKGDAAAAGATKTQINAINKLYIIEGDRDLKPVYESVIREMMAAYGVKMDAR